MISFCIYQFFNIWIFVKENEKCLKRLNCRIEDLMIDRMVGRLQ